MCDHEYEYETKGVFGTGHSSSLQHVQARKKQPPLGLLAAYKRGNKNAPKPKRGK